jgi:gluconolactonase
MPALLWWAIAAPSACADLLPAGATAVRLLLANFGFTEGPLYDPAGGGSILFTNLNGQDIVRYDIAAGTTTIPVPNSNAANGLYFDAGGHVVSADRNSQQISRRSLTDLAVVEEVLADNWNGTRFIGPNDLVIDSTGGIYFTDPNYSSSNPNQAVYYRSAAGVVSRLLTGFNKPNGVILSPDESTLYLAVEQEHRIMAYDVTAPGVLANPREFARTNVAPLASSTNGPDGLTVDPSGNVYAAVQNAIQVWSPSGARIMSLSVGMDPTNVELGGRNRKTLYITAGNSLYGVGLNVVPELPGDSDYDGDVDGDDLAVWRAEHSEWADGAGPTGAALFSDANGDGVADGADLLAWQRGLSIPATASSGASVPEPTGEVLLIGLCVCGFAASAGRGRSRGGRISSDEEFSAFRLLGKAPRVAFGPWRRSHNRVAHREHSSHDGTTTLAATVRPHDDHCSPRRCRTNACIVSPVAAQGVLLQRGRGGAVHRTVHEFHRAESVVGTYPDN